MMRKLIAGGPGRKTRLHSETGTFLPLREFTQVPHVVKGYVTTKLLGRRPDEPWWPMNVIAYVEKHLVEGADVVEFGAGSSSLWLAKRAKTVVSYEDNKNWRDSVSDRAKHLGLENLEVLHAEGEGFWSSVLNDSATYDFAVIDGSYRWKCISSVLHRMRPGGVIYLDNSDADKDAHLYDSPDDRHLAQSILRDYASTNPGSELFMMTSLISGELHVGEGMFLKVV